MKKCSPVFYCLLVGWFLLSSGMVAAQDNKPFKDYMEHPKHKKVIEVKLKPLVNRIVAYDFQ